MRYFMYLGDKEETYPFNMTFKRNEPTPVSDEKAIKKLLGNNHFKEVFPEKEEPEKVDIEKKTLTLKK